MNTIYENQKEEKNMKKSRKAYIDWCLDSETNEGSQPVAL